MSYGIMTVQKVYNERLSKKEVSFLEVEKNGIKDIIISSPSNAIQLLKNWYSVKLYDSKR